MKAATVSQMMEIDRFVAGQMGITPVILMENAGIAVAAHCLAYLRGLSQSKVVVVCGKGAKGGVGLVTARHLHVSGFEVCVIFVGNESGLPHNARVNLNIVRNLGISVENVPLSDTLSDLPRTLKMCDLVVDAMVGIGLRGRLEGVHEYIVDIMNTYGRRVIAVDVPSGVNADTGHVAGAAVRAHQTIVLGLPKIGLFLRPAADCTGEIIFERAAVPPGVEAHIPLQAQILTDAEIPELLPCRPKLSNKGSFGRIFAFAGSREMPGAAVLSCSAAYKAGGGLVQACVTDYVAGIFHNKMIEAVTSILPDRNGRLCRESAEAIAPELPRASVIIVGPGLGSDDNVRDFVYELCRRADCGMVIDADALNVIAKDPSILLELKRTAVLTPHPGEMSRLTGLPVAEILADKIEVARAFSAKYKTVTLLKGSGTVVASPAGEVYVNTTGSSALAKAGTGDVLAGLIAAFIAQGLDLFTAAMLGAYIHGKAGDVAEQVNSAYGVMATDLLEVIPKVLLRYAT